MWFLLAQPGTRTSCRFHFRLYTRGNTKGCPTMLIKEISHPDCAAEHLISSLRKKSLEHMSRLCPAGMKLRLMDGGLGLQKCGTDRALSNPPQLLQWIRGLNNTMMIEVTHPVHTELHPHRSPELPSAAENQTSKNMCGVGKKKTKCGCKGIYHLKPRLPEGDRKRGKYSKSSGKTWAVSVESKE